MGGDGMASGSTVPFTEPAADAYKNPGNPGFFLSNVHGIRGVLEFPFCNRSCQDLILQKEEKNWYGLICCLMRMM
jgi:hypothetical protein